MDPQKTKTSARDFFINLGAIVALYTTVVALLNLLFTVIDKAFPKINETYYVSSSISFPVATLIIFFPIYILLMYLLENVYEKEPDKKHLGVRKWLTYITLFIAGLTLSCDLVYTLYSFLDGQKFTTAFLMEIISIFVVAGCVFIYYIYDVLDRLSSKSRRFWFLVALCLILFSIVWGFVILGSPYTQRQIKYDIQRVSDLQNLESQIISDFQFDGKLPASYEKIGQARNSYFISPKDPQTENPYEYKILDQGTSTKNYEICALFNKKSVTNNQYFSYVNSYDGMNESWDHPEGRYCFKRSVPAKLFSPKVVPVD